MLKYLPKTTLSYFNAIPQRQVMNIGHVPVMTLAINCQTAMQQEYSSPLPETEAIEFYLLNHLASIIGKKFTPHQILPDLELEVMQAYSTCLAAQGQRMLYYLAMIVARESRHLYQPESLKPHVDKQFDPAVIKQIKAMSGKSPMDAASYFLDNPPKTTMGKYFGALPYIFSEGKFGSSFGGEPWAEVARCLAAFVEGKASIEMMLDTAFTLAHNNGPIFNKGMFYKNYVHGGQTLRKILDVQRSGQMPEMVMESASNSMFSKWAVLTIKFKAKYPDAFGEVVDWYAVEKLGALSKYTQEKSAMKVEKVTAKPIVIEGKTFKQAGSFTVLPGVTVPVLKRETVTT
jgi:hypothetical protein